MPVCWILPVRPRIDHLRSHTWRALLVPELAKALQVGAQDIIPTQAKLAPPGATGGCVSRLTAHGTAQATCAKTESAWFLFQGAPSDPRSWLPAMYVCWAGGTAGQGASLQFVKPHPGHPAELARGHGVLKQKSSPHIYPSAALLSVLMNVP